MVEKTATRIERWIEMVLMLEVCLSIGVRLVDVRLQHEYLELVLHHTACDCAIVQT